MLSRIQSWFMNDVITTKKLDENQHAIASIPPTDDRREENNSANSTWVYIWDTKPSEGSIGHVAIQVGGEQPKVNQTDAGKYASLWPRAFPAAGPLAFFPLPGHVEETLTADMQNEADEHQWLRMNPDDLTYMNASKRSDATNEKQPDQIYRIEGLNQEKMLSKIKDVEHNTQIGTQHYQLFAGVNFMSFLWALPSHLSLDPTDMAMHHKTSVRSKSENTRADNCATFAAEVLESGGMSVKKPNYLMGLSPHSLGNQLNAANISTYRR